MGNFCLIKHFYQNIKFFPLSYLILNVVGPVIVELAEDGSNMVLNAIKVFGRVKPNASNRNTAVSRLISYNYASSHKLRDKGI